MRYKYLIIFLFLFSSLNSKQIEKSYVKEMLLGNWKQINDINAIIVISNDTLKSYYKGKISEVYSLKFNFPKSEGKYFDVKNKTFRFDVNDTNNFNLELIDSKNVIITQQVNYVDENNLELGYNAGIVSFKRINSNENEFVK